MSSNALHFFHSPFWRRSRSCLGQIQGIQTTLADLLEDDEDLCLLHLTRFWNNPEEFDDLEKFDHDDAEVLMETAMQDVNRFSREISTLLTDISSTERLLDFYLNQVRNRLLAADLILSLLAISFSLATVVAGFFGTHFPSGFPGNLQTVGANACSCGRQA
eukprot:m.678399 g.678399  ORF g.678399 m.678399 type:complete len:161 (-) comp58578_c0_seq15:238-720(-)